MYRGEPNEIEPDWVKSERDQFKNFRDKDGNGVMDVAEVCAFLSIWNPPSGVVEGRRK